ncbi:MULTISPECIES: tRNA (guanine(10)-N(2))-dimethyltransferase [Methanothermobacter]|uniref:tRNA (guanine(26)-N(2))-dimethyltransferase n=1 Tax=Methanothermobacter wolfeii TaxID=145261 RepID=A0A9E7RTN3_METWO|nr:tRNA (guanine(10)-N(2))-dimethyltransferase [Methanothermobacter wolfeii]UXH31470.1 tRNA (guanine(10)-N(2))-dimethyltransferase [Methanothermobacter wolfeii]
MITVNEGSVKIQVPDFSRVSSKAPVFYNPDMEFNRDVSVLALQVFQRMVDRAIKVADTFAGSGIRAIRYLKEVDGVAEAWANDINPLAVECIERNSRMNSVSPLVSREDAGVFLRSNQGVFDFIDVDPFGTPAPFMDSAAAAIRNRSMIGVTATDTSGLCGTYVKPCLRKYSSRPLKTEYCHEIGVRILAGFTAMNLARYRKGSEFLLSHSTKHYMRLYVMVRRGARRADESLKNIGFILHCFSCLFHGHVNGFTPINMKCPSCGRELDVAGPLWVGDIQDAGFIGSMIEEAENKKLNQKEKVLRLLQTCIREAGMPPGFYDVHELCSSMGVSAPPIDSVMDHLRGDGFRVSRTHFKPTGIKTDADLGAVKDAIKGSLI